MTNSKLTELMVSHLKNLNKEHFSINDATIFKEVLSANDGRGTLHSKRLFVEYVCYLLITEGHENVSWPHNWMDFSVTELAEKILH